MCGDTPSGGVINHVASANDIERFTHRFVVEFNIQTNAFMTFTAFQTIETDQIPADTNCFVSWGDALKDLGNRDPEALDNFYAFDQGENSPFEIYLKICSFDIDTNKLFLDSLLASVEKCAGKQIDNFEIKEDGFYLY